MLITLTTISLLSFAAFSQTKEERLTLDELNKARALWDDYYVEDYQFTYRPICFCAPCFVLEKLITVFDSSVATVEFSNEDEAEENNCDDSSLNPNFYETIDELFDLLQNNTKTAAQIRATFDEEIGYPLSAFIDFDERIADEERSWTISSVNKISDDDIKPDITRTCDNGEEATITPNKAFACSDILVSDRETGATVCNALITKSDEEYLLVTFDTGSSIYDFVRIWLYVDDRAITYPVNSKGIINYREFDYLSGKIKNDDEKDLYQFKIPISTFELFDDICDFCNTRFTPSLYVTARVQLKPRRGRGRFGFVDMELTTSVDCNKVKKT